MSETADVADLDAICYAASAIAGLEGVTDVVVEIDPSSISFDGEQAETVQIRAWRCKHGHDHVEIVGLRELAAAWDRDSADARLLEAAEEAGGA